MTHLTRISHVVMVVFSRHRLSRLAFLRVLRLSELKIIGFFTRKIIFHVGNLSGLLKGHSYGLSIWF